jgi:hypothetical protein
LERTVRVKRVELLEKLTANRAKHVADFKTAMAEWVRQCESALERAYGEAREGFIIQNPLIDLPKPESFTSSYDEAIGMMEMEVRDEVEITAQEFQAWVQDNWSWRGRFMANSGTYLAG